MLVLLIVITGILSGAYPAFVLSSFRPVSLFRKTVSHRTKGFSLRNVLVVFQFAVSIALIICTLVAHNQLRHLRNRYMGYNREHIVVLPILDAGLEANIEPLRTELKRIPGVINASSSSSLLNNSTVINPVQHQVTVYLIDTECVEFFNVCCIIQQYRK